MDNKYKSSGAAAIVFLVFLLLIVLYFINPSIYDPFYYSIDPSGKFAQQAKEFRNNITNVFSKIGDTFNKATNPTYLPGEGNTTSNSSQQ